MNAEKSGLTSFQATSELSSVFNMHFKSNYCTHSSFIWSHVRVTFYFSYYQTERNAHSAHTECAIVKPLWKRHGTDCGPQRVTWPHEMQWRTYVSCVACSLSPITLSSANAVVQWCLVLCLLAGCGAHTNVYNYLRFPRDLRVTNI